MLVLEFAIHLGLSGTTFEISVLMTLFFTVSSCLKLRYLLDCVSTQHKAMFAAMEELLISVPDLAGGGGAGRLSNPKTIIVHK